MLSIRSDVKIIPLETTHAEKMAIWMQDITVSQNIGLRKESSFEKTIDWIKKAQADESIHPFAIDFQNNHVGNVILDKMDSYLGTARYSIYLGDQEIRSSGIGISATYQICKYGFEKLSLNKIWLTVHTKNLRAINSYTKFGFQLEGILREEFLLENELINLFYMGILKSEFENLKISVT